MGKGSNFIYWVSMTHRAAEVVNVFQLVSCRLITFMYNGSVLWQIHDPRPSKQAATALTNHDQHLHSAHHHRNSKFDEFGSFVTGAPHLPSPHTGPRLGPGSHCVSLVLLFLSALSFPNSNWHFYRMDFTHSLHKTTASPWYPSAFSA